jgi:hypothetical protein
MKIISMSVFGEKLSYIYGAKRQCQLAKKFFPEWNIRIYTDNKSNFNDVDNAEVIEITDGTYGVFWRFKPLFESEDNIVMVRDSDSRFTIREKLAVEEWLESDYKFHTFKDHEEHFKFPIMAGTFSYKGKLPDNLKASMHDFETNHVYYLSDQIYLGSVVWPYVESTAMVHSMNEGWFGETRNRLVSKYSFCGNGYDENDLPIYSYSVATQHGFTATENDKFDEGEMHEVHDISNSME